jgi:hypothetical protein
MPGEPESPQPVTLSSVTLDRALAAAGSAAGSFARFWESLWRQPYVSAGLLEECRRTLARLHGDAIELAAVNPFAGANGRARPEPAATERAVLLFAECYWGDAQAIPDDVADAVKAQLGEPGLVFLIEALGCIDGRIRSARCLRDLQAAHV